VIPKDQVEKNIGRRVQYYPRFPGASPEPGIIMRPGPDGYVFVRYLTRHGDYEAVGKATPLNTMMFSEPDYRKPVPPCKGISGRMTVPQEELEYAASWGRTKIDLLKGLLAAGRDSNADPPMAWSDYNGFVIALWAGAGICFYQQQTMVLLGTVTYNYLRSFQAAEQIGRLDAWQPPTDLRQAEIATAMTRLADLEQSLAFAETQLRPSAPESEEDGTRDEEP
jgi:hypothetical protein